MSKVLFVIKNTGWENADIEGADWTMARHTKAIKIVRNCVSVQGMNTDDISDIDILALTVKPVGGTPFTNAAFEKYKAILGELVYSEKVAKIIGERRTLFFKHIAPILKRNTLISSKIVSNIEAVLNPAQTKES